MKKRRINAITLNYILFVGILPLVGLSVFIFYSLFGTLEEKSKEASHAAIDSEVGASNIDHLRDLEAKLIKNQDVAKRAASIVADSKQYRYQDQIVNDINTYAKAAGVTILGFDFSETAGASEGGSEAGASGSGTSAPPSSAEPGSSQATPPQGSPAPAAAPGLKTVNASIQLDSPIPLTNFLIFLKYIEQNVTKMQITGVTLTPADDPNLISNPTINLTAYTR